jgi:hypothetical protein
LDFVRAAALPCLYIIIRVMKKVESAAAAAAWLSLAAFLFSFFWFDLHNDGALEAMPRALRIQTKRRRDKGGHCIIGEK